jgi:hypothetical protein
MNRYAILLGALLLLMLTTFSPTVSALDGNSIGNSIASAIRNIVVMIFEILTPIVNIIAVGMVAIGLLLGLGLRQEFIGFRLIVGGVLGLLTVHIIVPLLLQYV